MIRHGIFALVLAAVVFGCIRLGEHGARALERLLVDRAGHGLSVLELDWAEVRADGMRLELHGHAPDIFARDLALESTRNTAPLAVVIDHTTVSLAPPPRRDPVKVEILRDEQGLTLTGRFHGEAMRAGLIEALGASVPHLEVHDLTGVNAARPDPGFGPELKIASLAAARVPKAYVRIEPGAVRVDGLAQDTGQGRALPMELMELAGDTVRLTLQLREPLVVMAPFVFSVVRDSPGRMRLEACAARSAGEAVMLESALNRYGVGRGEDRCRAALGGPTGDWPGAALAGLEALDHLPAGRFRLEYHTAHLAGLPPARAAELESALVRLGAALPEGYGLLGGLEPGDDGPGVALRAPTYWMRFVRRPGAAEISGTVPDDTAARVIETYAAARFGWAALRTALAPAHSAAVVPQDWAAAAQVALDALSGVSKGEAELKPGRITVSGTVAGPAVAGRLHRLMAGEAPEGYVVESALRIDLPEQVAAVAMSAPRCAVVLSAAIAEHPIGFDPGSAVFETGSRKALDRLGDIFHRCAGGQIEIGGHTDSQGSERLNQRLSRARAEAVLDALMARGVALDRMAARGYGEEQPVASNETEAGRALNRRIEFRAVE